MMHSFPLSLSETNIIIPINQDAVSATTSIIALLNQLFHFSIFCEVGVLEPLLTLALLS